MATLFADLKLAFPFIQELGLTAAWFQETAAESASSAEIVQRIRQTPQYKARFPGLNRTDGSLRMTEAQYLQQEQSYRTLLRQFGHNMQDYTTPDSLKGFFEGEIAPQELQDRLTVYKGVKEGGQSFKDAFFAYAGLDVTDDDLYDALVDPSARKRLFDAYKKGAAGTDYPTFINRAANIATARFPTGTDFNTVQQFLDAIVTGGGEGRTLNLQEMLDSFEFAAIGATATNVGLALPTKERLAEIRAAGVEKAKAQSAYRDYGLNQGSINAAVQRARGTVFGQEQFESGTFLGGREDALALEAGVNYMEASGKDQGEFRFSEEDNRIVQRGFTNY